MTLSSLTAISPLDGRYSKKLDGLRNLVSEYGLIYYRTQVEIAWLHLLAKTPEIKEVAPLSEEQAQFLNSILDNFDLADAETVKEIEATTNHDVKAVEYFLQKKLGQREDLKKYLPFLHFACTSEDINNLAYALMLRESRDNCLIPHLKTLIQNLTDKANKYKLLPMLSRTHGQNATPTTLGKEFANVVARLNRQLNLLENQSILGKFNGAVGNYNAHHTAYENVNWPNLAQFFVCSLGLNFNPHTTQIEPHDYIAEYLQTITRINTIFLDFSRDAWGYISLGYFSQKQREGEVGSSTMPHKVNPIDFENAEGNLGLANAVAQHLAQKLPISRWQRDLSDSTVLRNLGCALGYSLLAYDSLQKGLNKITANRPLIEQSLSSCWELLAEPIQTVMRRHGILDAYEQLKSLTRGKSITKESVRSFIEQSQLPDEAKKSLLALTPESYLGYAVSLTEKMSDNNR